MFLLDISRLKDVSAAYYWSEFVQSSSSGALQTLNYCTLACFFIARLHCLKNESYLWYLHVGLCLRLDYFPDSYLEGINTNLSFFVEVVKCLVEVNLNHQVLSFS